MPMTVSESTPSARPAAGGRRRSTCASDRVGRVEQRARGAGAEHHHSVDSRRCRAASNGRPATIATPRGREDARAAGDQSQASPASCGRAERTIGGREARRPAEAIQRKARDDRDGLSAGLPAGFVREARRAFRARALPSSPVPEKSKRTRARSVEIDAGLATGRRHHVAGRTVRRWPPARPIPRPATRSTAGVRASGCRRRSNWRRCRPGWTSPLVSWIAGTSPKTISASAVGARADDGRGEIEVRRHVHRHPGAELNRGADPVDHQGARRNDRRSRAEQRRRSRSRPFAPGRSATATRRARA